MAYEKNNWQSGDVVTSEKLNHLEDGVSNAGGTLVIGGFSNNQYGNVTGTSDKTWQEIHDALAAGKECIAIFHDGDMVWRAVIIRVYYDGEGTYVIGEDIAATCDSPDGYPAASTE